MGPCRPLAHLSNGLKKEIRLNYDALDCIPSELRQNLRQYSLNILGALDPVVSQERLDEGNFSVEEFGEVLSQIIDHRRSEQTPKSDGEILMSLILGDVNGRRLTNTELIQNCIFLLNAGHETTTSMVANSMHMFFSAPDQLNLLQAPL